MILRETLREYAERFEGVVSWMSAQGLRTHVGRVREYQAALATFLEGSAKGKTSEEKLNLIEQFYESYEVLLALEALAGLEHTPDGAIGTVREMLRGPTASRDEDPSTSSNRARNKAFELIVGGKQLEIGVKRLSFSEPDLTFFHRKRNWLVACKRAQGVDDIDLERDRRAVSNLARRANQQLRKASTSTAAPICVIALDISKLANPRGDVAGAGSQTEAKLICEQTLDAFATDFYGTWKGINDFRAHCFLVRFSRLFITPEAVWHCQEWSILQTKRKNDRWLTAKLRGWAGDIDQTPASGVSGST